MTTVHDVKWCWLYTGEQRFHTGRNFVLEELDNPKEWQYVRRVDFFIATRRLSFGDQYKKNSCFQVGVNHLEVMKSMYAYNFGENDVLAL